MTTNIKERIKYANDELISKGNLDVVDEIFSKDYVAHAGEKEYSGCEFVKRFIGQLRRSLPDIQIVDIVFLAEDQATNAASFVDDLGADSLDTVELVMALEEEFECEIPDEEAEKITTIQQAIDYVNAHTS